MNNAPRVYDPLLDREIDAPPGWQPRYQFRRNLTYNDCVDIGITLGGYTVFFNTNEQRFIHNYKRIGEHRVGYVGNLISAARAEANRQPCEIPDMTVDLLDKVINHYLTDLRRIERDTEAHWYKVNLDFGYGDRGKVEDEDVEPLSDDILALYPNSRQAEARDDLLNQRLLEYPKREDSLSPQASAPQTSASRARRPKREASQSPQASGPQMPASRVRRPKREDSQSPQGSASSRQHIKREGSR